MAQLNSEILGDWNNLKGTHYHLVYGLWLLLREGATTVAFFQGNDLLARPATPPLLQDADLAGAVVTTLAQHAEKDVWIQLKSTTDSWSPSAILEGTLVQNFIGNALASNLSGRPWLARLVTQGYVDRSAILEFADSPSDKPILARNLNNAVEAVSERLRNAGISPIPDSTSIRNLALEICRQLAATKPVMLSTLKAEIERELAFCYPSRRRVGQLCSMLLGAMLEDAAGGPLKARTYDIEWLTNFAGPGIKSTKIFDRDAVAACDVAIGCVTPDASDPSRYIPRMRLDVSFRQFLKSTQSVFVLLGKAGAGRKWALRHFMTEELSGRIRFLVKDSALDAADSVASLAEDTFADLSAGHLTTQQYLQLLRAASVADLGPLVVGIDNLRANSESADAVRRKLGRLAEQALAIGAKLILTCNEETWELLGLGREIPAAALFRPTLTEMPNDLSSSLGERMSQGGAQLMESDANDRISAAETRTKENTSNASYVLGDLTLDEMLESLRRRLPTDRLIAAKQQLRCLDLTLLRNPYLFDRYFEIHGSQFGLPEHQTTPVDVDKLLDERIDDRLQQVAEHLAVDSESVRLALDHVVQILWERRSDVTRSADVIKALEEDLPSLGDRALQKLRLLGFISVSGAIEVREKPMAIHLFAKNLNALLARGEAEWSMLRPQVDGEVVSAAVRMSPCPLFWVEAVTPVEPRWVPWVARGLALCSPVSPELIAALVGLTRPGDDDRFAEIDACRALGVLAARSALAWERVEEMYFSGNPHEETRAANALSATMELTPEMVGKVVEKRLRFERLRRNSTPEQRNRQLREALDPLHNLTHSEAAQIATNVLGKCAQFTTRATSIDAEIPREVIDDAFTEAFDDVRGRAAIHGEPHILEGLLLDLESRDAVVRYRAAVALRPASFEQPDRIRTAVCDAIRQEQSAQVLHRLLWTGARFQEMACEQLLDALAVSAIARWDDATVAVPALVFLGHAARHKPDVVRRVLPARLDNLFPDGRAYVSEMFVYAWWNVAAHDSEVKAQLETLCRPDLEGVSECYRPFALRSAAIARLALAFQKVSSVDDVEVSRINFRNGGWCYFMLDAADLIEEILQGVDLHAALTDIQRPLVDCVLEDHRCAPDVRNDSLTNARFFAARDCLDALAQVARRMSDPLPLLCQLPRNWQALYVVRHLLRTGHKEPVLLRFAQEACDEHENVAFCQAAHERDLCRTELERAGETVARRSRSPIQRLFSSDAETGRFACNIDSVPDNLLGVLDGAVREPFDLPTLYEWERTAHSWRGLLFARLFRRMFAERSLRRVEAEQLVEHTLTAVRDLPESTLRTEFGRVYFAIKELLVGRGLNALELPEPGSAIQRSHRLAIEALIRAAEARHKVDDSRWLDDFLGDRRGWWETANCEVKDGSMSRGTGLYLIWFFPAVRLALAAIGFHFGLIDPAAGFMRRRRRGAQILKKYDWLWITSFEPSRESLARGLSSFADATIELPDDERLWHCCGNLALRLDQLPEAEEYLQRSVALRSSDATMRGLVLYDLACVYSRRGDEASCRTAMEEATRLKPPDPASLVKDPDLASVRESPWFQAILTKPSAEEPKSPRRVSTQ